MKEIRNFDKLPGVFKTDVATRGILWKRFFNKAAGLKTCNFIKKRL